MKTPRPRRDLFRHFAEPALRVSAAGDTLEANPAFDELAAHCGVAPRLAELFGPAIAQLLGRTGREGWTRALVPVMAGPQPRPLFRMSLYPIPQDGSPPLPMIDVSEELAGRRPLFERNHVLTLLNDVGAALRAPPHPH